MRKTNWNNVIKSSKLIKKNVKTTQQVVEFLKDYPAEGYMRDNISKNHVLIKDCKSSSLRRYAKLLDNFYYLVTSESDKNNILKKKVEVEEELNTRPDAIIGDENK